MRTLSLLLALALAAPSLAAADDTRPQPQAVPLPPYVDPDGMDDASRLRRARACAEEGDAACVTEVEIGVPTTAEERALLLDAFLVLARRHAAEAHEAASETELRRRALLQLSIRERRLARFMVRSGLTATEVRARWFPGPSARR